MMAVIRVSPHNYMLLTLAVGLQLLLIAGPMMLWSPRLLWLASGLIATAAVTLFSARRTLLLMFFLTIALPATVLEGLILPGGLRLQEALLLAAAFFVAVDLLYTRCLFYQASALDGPVAVFLLVALFSAAVGAAAGNLTTVILRDVRFPLYYMVVFLVTQTTDTAAVLRRYMPVMILASLAVSLGYILEFAGAIDLSGGTRFMRVARLHGLVLPVALLVLLNQFIYDPERYGRWPLVLLFLPISLAFVITVGRGMWLAFAAGALTTILLWHRGRPRGQRRAWQAVLLIGGLMVTIVVTVLFFQRLTGAAIGVYTLERSLTFVDFRRDVQFLGRLSSYLQTVQRIASRPWLGSGQGATLPFLFFDAETYRFSVHHSWTVDSLYLALWWKMGIAGLVAFAWMALRTSRLALYVRKHTGAPGVRAFAGGMIAVAVGMVVLGATDASMVNSRFAVVFGVLFGLVAVVHRELREEASAAGERP